MAACAGVAIRETCRINPQARIKLERMLMKVIETSREEVAYAKVGGLTGRLAEI
jgi:hypothetical protein